MGKPCTSPPSISKLPLHYYRQDFFEETIESVIGNLDPGSICLVGLSTVVQIPGYRDQPWYDEKEKSPGICPGFYCFFISISAIYAS
jgi:hypothetical protein